MPDQVILCQRQLDIPLEPFIPHVYNVSEEKKKEKVVSGQGTTWQVYGQRYDVLHERISSIVDEILPDYMIRNSFWNNVSPPGGYNKSHKHGDVPYIVIFYVQTPGGNLVFDNDNIEITPYPGLLIIAKNVYHSVTLNNSNEDRISISGNITDREFFPK